MLESALYLASSFWLGALHAATPGHGKTISAAYLVGMRGRPADALALGVFVTLAHTSGIILFAIVATIGSATLSQRSESYVALLTALLILGLGVQMLVTRWCIAPLRRGQGSGVAAAHAHPHEDEHGHEHEPGGAVAHSHGWGAHTHELKLPGQSGPSWAVLLSLSIAGGLLPDPAALAVLLAAISTGKLVLGLFTVLVFSLGFASVLVLAALAVGRFGHWALARVSARWVDRAQTLTAVVVVVVGAVMTVGAARQLADWR